MARVERMVGLPTSATNDTVGAKRMAEMHRQERRNKALALWMAGTPLKEMCVALNLTGPAVTKLINEAIDQMRPHADFDRYRSTQLAEIEFARKVVRKVLATWEDRPFKDVKDAITSLLRLQDQEAKLIGLHRVTTPIDEIAGIDDEELEKMAAEWAAEFAAD